MHTSISARISGQGCKLQPCSVTVKGRQTAWKLIVNKTNQPIAGFFSRRTSSYYLKPEGDGDQRDCPHPHPPLTPTPFYKQGPPVKHPRLLRKPQGDIPGFPITAAMISSVSQALACLRTQPRPEAQNRDCVESAPAFKYEPVLWLKMLYSLTWEQTDI